MQFIKIQGLHLTCKAKGQEKDYNSGKGKAQDCVFPFIHNDQKFASCAASKDGMGNYCATKVDSNGNLVEGNGPDVIIFVKLLKVRRLLLYHI